MSSERWRRVLMALIFGTAVPACGSSTDAASAFVGTWTFSSGMLTPMCSALGAALPPVSLAGLSVTLTEVDAKSLTLTAGAGTGCVVTFDVAGTTATARSGQTCALDAGSLGKQYVGITTWTLMLSGGQIASNTAGTVLVCTAMGSGTLVPGGGDAGTD